MNEEVVVDNVLLVAFQFRSKQYEYVSSKIKNKRTSADDKTENTVS